MLVCVKTHQTESILDDLAAAVGDETVLIALQNGVESDEQLAARFGRRRVLPAAVYVGATIDEPGVVSHQAPARISIGARQGFDDRRLAAMHEVLAATGQRGAGLARHSARALAQADVERELQHGVGRDPAHAGRTARPA